MADGVRPGHIAVLAAGICLLAAPAAEGQLRVVTWNVTNYTGGRVQDIQTAVYGVYAGRSMAPDIIIGQEFISTTGVTAFRNALNTAPGSPGDWAAAPFINGPDTDNALFYRTSKVIFLSPPVVVSQGGYSPDPPRHTIRYNLRLQGYTSSRALLACYSSHMKAGGSSSDLSRRLLEAQRIRDDAQSLNPDWHFLLVGDFNIPASSQSAYQELIGSQANNDGRFFDPINTPGNWNNSSSYRFVHTQDPAQPYPVGMDDRFDQLLLCDDLIDGDGFDYIGNPFMAYSTTTWNDPQHSHRAWGNDGTSFNDELTVSGNQMVGPTIAQALKNVATSSGGHLPVFLDLRVPPEIDSDDVLDFGLVEQNALAEAVLAIWNAGDVALWNAEGIADLTYDLAPSAGFGAPGGTFVSVAGDPANQHIITMDTSTIGPVNGTLVISANAPDKPSRVVTLVGEVTEPAGDPGDLDCDGDIDFDDINPFVLALNGESAYLAQYPECRWLNADCDEDGDVDFDDINPFVALLGG